MAHPDNPYAPPGAEVADIATGAAQLAGRGARLVAVLVDGALQIGALLLLSKLLPWSIFDTAPSTTLMLGNALISICVFMLINGTLLVTRGQSVGKLLLGVRVVRSDGSRADAVRILGLRYALGFVLAVVPFVGAAYSLIDSLFIFRESRRCLHDLIADTIVVRA